MNEDYEKEKDLCEKELKWSGAKAGIGLWKIISSAEVWVFITASILFVMFAPKDNAAFWIAYLSLGAVFMFFKPLSKLIGRGNLNVNANVGASITKNISGGK